MEQLNLMEGERRRDDAIGRADANASDDWKRAARWAIVSVASTRSELTTDDVWAVLDRTGYGTHERRALGAAMRAVAAEGVIASTGTYRKSERPESHARPVLVWRSVICPAVGR
jgi:threonine dehydrogenase-like Zn-dependent dehydrogenase